MVQALEGRSIRKLLLLVFLTLAGGAVGRATAPALKGPFPVSIGKSSPQPSGGRLAASSTSAGTLTVDWDNFCVNHDGSGAWTIHFASSTGQTVGRLLRVDAACTQVTDNFGNVVYTTTGGADAVCTTLSGAVTRSNSLLSSCATGAKCNL
jgi:hypothetical protein